MTELIKPYGDTLNDGKIQLSFTLPIELGPKAKKAAEIYCSGLGLENVAIVSAEKIMDGFSYFVVYAKSSHSLDYSKIEVTEIQAPQWDFYKINEIIEQNLGRKMKVVGASIGPDAHTVGIDAIMNMKGHHGHYGLERYPQIEALNLGAQVPSIELYKKALEFHADAILVSQTVTQKDAHIQNFTELIEILEGENVRSKFLLIAGGPRISNDLALEMGYDAGFGPGTVASHVASFIITQLLKRKGITL